MANGAVGVTLKMPYPTVARLFGKTATGGRCIRENRYNRGKTGGL
jgi:hypothetical protein